MGGGQRTGIGVLLGVAGLALLWVYLLGPLLACPGECFVDYPALRGNVLGRMELHYDDPASDPDRAEELFDRLVRLAS